MAFEHNNDSGSVFRNERKENDKQPDFTGSAKVDDKEYWLSMWTKPPAPGKKGYFSLAFTAKDEPKAPTKYHQDEDDIQDDIPF